MNSIHNEEERDLKAVLKNNEDQLLTASDTVSTVRNPLPRNTIVKHQPLPVGMKSNACPLSDFKQKNSTEK